MTQVNSVSSVQSNNYRRADYKEALATAGMGGVAWTAGEYLFNKKPFLDKSKNVTDFFVTTIKEGLEGIKDPKLIENQEYLKNIKTQIDNCTTKEQLQEFFKNNKKDLYGKNNDFFEYVSKNINEIPELSDTKERLKFLFEKDGKNKSYIQEIYQSCCDEAGKLVHDAQKVSKEKFDLIKNTASKFRINNALKSGISFAVISAITLCIFECFAGRKAKKQAQNNAQ